MTPATRKLCIGRCGRRLPLSEFHRSAHSPGGRRARCRDCIAADRRDARQDAADAALAERLAAEGVATVAGAYRKGRENGAADALRYLRQQGRLLPSDDEAAAQARAERIAAMADEALAR